MNTRLINQCIMRNTTIFRNQIYSFLIPSFMDGLLGLVQTAIPLLAMRLGASVFFLGMLGWIPQAVRLPLCMTSGMLSDKFGRVRVILASTVIAVLACIGLALAHTNLQVIVIYSFLMASVGAFYPSLQAFVGDRSVQGDLRRNLSAFNLGWTIGGAICATTAGFLLVAGVSLPFVAGATMAMGVFLLVLSWSRSAATAPAAVIEDAVSHPVANSVQLLLIARVGHFLGFFGYGMVRNIFPKLAKSLHMDEKVVGLVAGTIIVGEAVGMLISSSGPWWRGKLWPLILAQSMMVIAAYVIFIASSTYLLAGAIFFYGASMVITYTGALYYGLQSSERRGRNTAIHESLVAGSIIMGSLIGGTSAQLFSLRTPYIILSAIALLAVLFSLTYWFSSVPSRRE